MYKMKIAHAELIELCWVKGRSKDPAEGKGDSVELNWDQRCPCHSRGSNKG